jgi:predicted nucleic acid-binding protein
MNSGVSSLLVDTDVLAYAAVEQYQDHAAARSRIRGFRKQGCRLFISPQNLREFVAVLTKPKAFSIPLRRADVLAAAAGLTVRYGLLPEPPAVSMRLLDLLYAVQSPEVMSTTLTWWLQHWSTASMGF